jgi:hypothetical protein
VGQKPTRKGFGGRIIEQMIGQLNGEARFEWRTEGLVCEKSISGREKVHQLPNRKSKTVIFITARSHPFSLTAS